MSLLFNDNPLVIGPIAATVFGLNESLIMQQIHYWLGKSKKCYDGKPWVYNTYEEWNKQFPFWCTKTIKRTIRKLEQQGYVVSSNFNQESRDRTKWYTLDYDAINSAYEVFISSSTGQVVHSDSTINSDNNALIDPKNTINAKNDFLIDPKGTKCPHAKGQNVPTITRDYLQETTDILSHSSLTGLRECNLSSKDKSFNDTNSACACVNTIDYSYINNMSNKDEQVEKGSLNWAVVKNQIRTVGKDLEFSNEELEICEKTIWYYYEQYKKRTRHDHPALNNLALSNVMSALVEHDVHYADLQYLVKCHFKTEYAEDIDFNVIHFTQPNILGTLMTNNGLRVS